MSLYYVDLSLPTSAMGSGTIGDPYNCSAFLTSAITSGGFASDGDTFLLKGFCNVTSAYWTSGYDESSIDDRWEYPYYVFSDPNKSFNISAWDLETLGPWTIKFSRGEGEQTDHDHGNRIDFYKDSLQGGILYSTSADDINQKYTNLYNMYINFYYYSTEHNVWVKPIELSGTCEIHGCSLLNYYWHVGQDWHGFADSTSGTLSLRHTVIKGTSFNSFEEENWTLSAANNVLSVTQESMQDEFANYSFSGNTFEWNANDDYNEIVIGSYDCLFNQFPFTSNQDGYDWTPSQLLADKSVLSPFSNIPVNLVVTDVDGYSTGMFGEERTGAGAFWFGTVPTDPLVTISFSKNSPYSDENVLSTATITNSVSVSSFDWDFGDGSTSANVTSAEYHSWNVSVATTYSVKVTAYGTEGGTGTASKNITVYPSISADTSVCVLSSDYIELCGKDPIRFGTCKVIDLTSFLPEHLVQSDTLEFVHFFEKFLNTLYNGSCGMEISSTEITEASGTGAASATDVDMDQYSYSDPTIGSVNGPCSECSSYDATDKISILEKVFRLRDLQDPDLIDIDYIQFFANNLGYNINVNKQEMGNLGESTSGVCSENEANRYLRFMVTNLPHWYKIKSTRNAIKIMLFSFGLIGDIINYYTDNYTDNWRASRLEYNTSAGSLYEDLDKIPNSYYPTPHFAIWFDIKQSTTNFSFNVEKQQAIIRAIDSIKPINTVFEGVSGYFQTLVNYKVTLINRVRKYIHIPPNDGYSDWWNV